MTSHPPRTPSPPATSSLALEVEWTGAIPAIVMATATNGHGIDSHHGVEAAQTDGDATKRGTDEARDRSAGSERGIGGHQLFIAHHSRQQRERRRVVDLPQHGLHAGHEEHDPHPVRRRCQQWQQRNGLRERWC